MTPLDKILKNNKGAINKTVAIVMGALLFAGAAGYGLYNQKNNNEISNSTLEYEQINEQENRTKGIETILNEFQIKGYDIEHFSHGEIKSILDDGRILFEKDGLMVYDNGKITKSAYGDNVDKVAAIMNGDNFVKLDDIHRLKENGDLEYFIGNKAVKTSIGEIWTYDSVGSAAMNNDKSLLAFEYRKPFGTPHFSTSANTYLAIQKIKESEVITFKILDILKDSESRKEAIIELTQLNEEFERVAVLGVMENLLPNTGTEDVISASNMYDLVFNGKTQIIDGMFNVNISSKDKDEERNTKEYNFDKISLIDEQGKRYPTSEDYPNIYKMCWVKDDLYMRAKLNRNDKESNIYKINFANKNFSSDKIPLKLIDGNKESQDTKINSLYCFEEGHKIYLLTNERNLEYFDLKSEGIKNISDASVAGLVSGSGKISFQDNQGNNFIMKLK